MAGVGGIDQLMLCRRLGEGREGGREGGTLAGGWWVTARAFKLIPFQHSTLICILEETSKKKSCSAERLYFDSKMSRALSH